MKVIIFICKIQVAENNVKTIAQSVSRFMLIVFSQEVMYIKVANVTHQ